MGMTPTFEAAADAGIITPDQAAKLAVFYHDRPPAAAVGGATTAASAEFAAGPRFDLAHTRWYFGALIVLSAMGMFSTIAFASLGPGALLVTAIVYAAAFAFAGDHLWRRRDLKIPGGLLITIAVGMAPMAVFAVQEMTGAWVFAEPGNYKSFFDYVKGGWLPMEIATLIVALVAIRFYRFGFIAMVAAVMLWFMSMDLTPWIAQTSDFSWSLRATVSMWFGLGLIVAAWLVDVRQRKADYAFWLHLAGAAAFWGGLTFQNSDSELAKFLYCLLNVGLMGFAVFLSRRVYAVFGALGVMTYLGYLSAKLFMDSALFPFALSGLGIGVIALGLFYHRHSARLAAAFERYIPDALKKLRPAAR